MCGKIFDPKVTQQIYDSEKCRKEYCKIFKPLPTPKPKKKHTFSDTLNKCKKEGLRYSEYQMKETLKLVPKIDISIGDQHGRHK